MAPYFKSYVKESGRADRWVHVSYGVKLHKCSVGAPRPSNIIIGEKRLSFLWASEMGGMLWWILSLSSFQKFMNFSIWDIHFSWSRI
jgi:hypothetical protein